MSSPYEILDRKRRGTRLDRRDIESIVEGAVDGSWDDAQLAAFLMAAAVQGLDGDETVSLTETMLASGERWDLASEITPLGDKHSTGGVGDKTTLILGPLLAACGLPTAMLTGRGLGHTGGTADKLEAIPGLRLDLTRSRMIETIERAGMAIGIATEQIAPADRKLYAIRNLTGTVSSPQLIAASILSKKLAMGAGGVIYDVKTGSGAFLPDIEFARQLARLLVSTSATLGGSATALLTDMSQPLGRWVGHNAEVLEALECLSGEGPADLRELVLRLALELAELMSIELAPARLESALSSGEGRESFLRWAEAQGADASWLASSALTLAPEVVPLVASTGGYLSAVDTRRLGLLLAAAGGGRRRAADVIDRQVSLCYERRIGECVESGDRLATLYLRSEDADLIARFETCFRVGEEEIEPPPLVLERIGRR